MNASHKKRYNGGYYMCVIAYIWKKLKYSIEQLNKKLRDTFVNRMHSQKLILNWNEMFCKGVK